MKSSKPPPILCGTDFSANAAQAATAAASLVGSVTHAVLQQTFRPVFLVRPPAE